MRTHHFGAKMAKLTPLIRGGGGVPTMTSAQRRIFCKKTFNIILNHLFLKTC